MLLIFSLAILLSSCLYSQVKLQEGHWLPKEYLDSVSIYKHHVNPAKFNKPIQTIVVDRGRISVQTYMGELTTIPDHDVIFLQAERAYELKNVSHLFNMMYNSPADYKNRKFYLSNSGRYLLLRTTSDDSVDSIYFTKSIDDVNIIRRDEAVKILLMSGNYDLYDGKGQLLERGISVKTDGTIANSRYLSHYEILRVNLPDKRDGRLFNVVELKIRSVPPEVRRFAVQYEEGELLFFSFINSSDNYHLEIEELLFEMKPL